MSKERERVRLAREERFCNYEIGPILAVDGSEVTMDTFHVLRRFVDEYNERSLNNDEMMGRYNMDIINIAGSDNPQEMH